MLFIGFQVVSYCFQLIDSRDFSCLVQIAIRFLLPRNGQPQTSSVIRVKFENGLNNDQHRLERSLCGVEYNEPLPLQSKASAQCSFQPTINQPPKSLCLSSNAFERLSRTTPNTIAADTNNPSSGWESRVWLHCFLCHKQWTTVLNF